MMKRQLNNIILGASLICLLSSLGCGGGGGGGSSSKAEENESNSATSVKVQGKLAQGYVGGAQVWFDRFSADGTGNFQRDPGEPDTTSGNDGSYTLTVGAGEGVLMSIGGTYLDAAGQKVEAAPMLAPLPSEGQAVTNITPLTTLVAYEPELKETLQSLGDWNSDIAASTGTSAPLLRIAKTVEGLAGMLGQGEGSIALNQSAQLRSIEIFASQLSTLPSEELTSTDSLVQASTTALDLILEDQTLVNPLGGNVKNEIRDSMNSLVTSITNAIPESGQVVESEVVSEIEKKRTEIKAAIENELDQQVTISIGGFGLEFDPIISKITLQLTDGTLYISGEASDERPSTLSYRWDTSPALNLVDRFSANSRLGNFDNSSLTVIWRVTDDRETSVTEYCTWDNGSNPTICDYLSR
ncbi:MAG: hypothetical protein P8O70_07010 [SAR324 cluster bacterium]|nr:hypothetical protein [SAR324 cluster bacterium]